MSNPVVVKVVMDAYSGIFFKRELGSGWVEIGSIGHAGVAEDFVRIIQALGHRVEIAYEKDENEMRSPL